MMIWISSSLDICTYIPYVYIRTVRSGKVGTVHIHPHISAGTRQQNRKSFLTIVYIPESPVPMKKYQRCEDHRPTVSRLFFFQFQFTSRPALGGNPSPEPSPWLEQKMSGYYIPIHTLLYMPLQVHLLYLTFTGTSLANVHRLYLMHNAYAYRYIHAYATLRYAYRAKEESPRSKTEYSLLLFKLTNKSSTFGRCSLARAGRVQTRGECKVRSRNFYTVDPLWRDRGDV